MGGMDPSGSLYMRVTAVLHTFFDSTPTNTPPGSAGSVASVVKTWVGSDTQGYLVGVKVTVVGVVCVSGCGVGVGAGGGCESERCMVKL